MAQKGSKGGNGNECMTRTVIMCLIQQTLLLQGSNKVMT